MIQHIQQCGFYLGTFTYLCVCVCVYLFQQQPSGSGHFSPCGAARSLISCAPLLALWSSCVGVFCAAVVHPLREVQAGVTVTDVTSLCWRRYSKHPNIKVQGHRNPQTQTNCFHLLPTQWTHATSVIFGIHEGPKDMLVDCRKVDI